MNHDDFMSHLLKDERARECLKAALARSESGSILPIGTHLTPVLLEGIYPEFVGWMIDLVKRHDASETQVVFNAIAESDKFKHLLNCAMESVSTVDGKGVMDRDTAMTMMTVLMLICGWKLCERAMEGAVKA